jgi:tetratricopeptide (TPR) repeat protein
MDEQAESRADETGGYGKRDVDPAAAALALGSASRAKADSYLDEQMVVARAQTEVLHLQAHELKHELKLRHWSLRVRHISDVMKLSFEIAVAFIFLSIATAIGFEIWDAAHDDGLVIEAFQVPPDMAAHGLSGQVVAGQLLDKLTAMQNDTTSARPAQSYANNWGNDVKVQIPDTGISIGEFNRYLHAWLGHETHIEGEVFRTANGITVTARVSGDGGATFSGPETDLDTLLQKAAERIYRQTQPYRFAQFRLHGLVKSDPAEQKEAEEVLTQLTANPNRDERAWAWLGLANIARFRHADIPTSSIYFRKALAEQPNFLIATLDLGENEASLNHDEAALTFARATEKIYETGQLSSTERSAVGRVYRLENLAQIDSLLGDFGSAIAESRIGLDLPDIDDSLETFRQGIITALSLEHDGGAVRAYLKSLPTLPQSDASDRTNRMEAVFLGYAGLQDWQALVATDAEIEKAQRLYFPNQDSDVLIAVGFRPWFALAKAKLGDIPGADVVIAKTPLDCYDCVRVRGSIAALAHRPNAADAWFADAVKEAPSIPFAYTDWGAALLAEGHTDAAVAKFKRANEKGPHFADPLEMWGEALMLQNRSDLALAKFAEADKYAPNWGRLHLKWGEALFYAGKPGDAKKQFATAATLDLSPADRAALETWKAGHG